MSYTIMNNIDYKVGIYIRLSREDEEVANVVKLIYEKYLKTHFIETKLVIKIKKM